MDKIVKVRFFREYSQMSNFEQSINDYIRKEQTEMDKYCEVQYQPVHSGSNVIKTAMVIVKERGERTDDI